MPTAAFNKFNLSPEDWLLAKTNYGSDTFKALLTNTAPLSSNHVYGDISANELANGSGYTTGGAAVTMAASFSSGSGTATTKIYGTAGSPTWTAAGSMGPFRYVVVYDNSAVTQTLQAWFDYGTSLTLNSGDTFTITFDATNGFFTVV